MMAFGIMLLLGVIASYYGFNLDVEEPMVFQEDGVSFGQSVAQFGRSRLVVGAPLEVVAVNRTGRLYDCAAATGLCQPISLHTPPEAVNMSLGLSLAASTNRSWLLACGPTMHRACGENMYAEGFCFLLGSHLQTIRTVPAALPKCPSQEMDIVFLIDGSGSIDQRDFKQMKDFVIAVMGQFEGTNTLFSLMQYSNHLEIHFTFTKFQRSSSPQSLVDPIRQLKGLTFTATGILKVVKELFHSRNGARESAKKILIVITDGQKYKDPLEYSDVMPLAEKAGIIRYAIGVGDAFQEPTAREELNTIGSVPSQDHVFKVDNFAALSSIQKQLQEKIFAVEGTQSRTSSSFQHEMSQEGFSSVLTMRIASSQLSPTLQYFGQSLSGGQDLTQDGLVDLAVGARGQVLLLRSQPVLNVGVTMRFMPSEVAKAVYQCWEEVPTTLEAGNATVCLTIHKNSLDQLGDVQSSVRYDLALDPSRLISRAIFDETKNRTLSRRKTLGLGDYCETIKLLLPDCVEDVLSPIILHFNFSLAGEPIPSSQNLRPVLAVGSQDLFTASLPFEKNCGQDHLCEGDLSVSLISSGLQTLVVGSSVELNVTVTLWNEGEDSYGTVINFYYPAGLSYRRVLGTQQPHQRPLRLECEAAPTGNESLRSSSCSINHPIFHEGTKGTFLITFDVSYKATLGDKLFLRANVSSENNKPASSKTTFQLELPVKYAVYMVISRQEESTKYFNFSTSGEKSKKEAEHRYRVNNLSQRDLAISIHFWVPILLNGVAVWDVAVVAPSQSLPCVSEKEPPQHPEFLTQIPGSLVLNCSIAVCLRFRCDLPSFGIQEEVEFILKGNLSFDWVSQTLQKKVLIVSVAEITFNRSMYSQLPGQEAFLSAQMEMVLEKYEVYNSIPIIMGSSLGGLLLLALITAILYKVGFFKRQYKEMIEEANGQTISENGTSDHQVAQ
ncbi:integrin alpha-D-like isoform X4 [Leopardus geoffroyi]|uniref:integrin alpha-D-like isoform X4 n=1 Tax=Leopardus geoffroyi TaxID=46844 RepID=UPI001E26218B|nr:integrin alpha-D-like isoform X4 [Leopardus geoffroyi]